MRRISPSNPVRRCLFPSEGDDEGKRDNINNVFQEMYKQEAERAKEQWNYDTENDAPLPGKRPVYWKGKNENGVWVGVINDTDTDENDETDEENKSDENEPKEEAAMQLEATPAPKAAVKEPPTPTRKRSRENSPTDTSAKRKLDL
ncbi:uncharacterized protein LOC114350651 [Ostrinia furnacalis]|uniref:uncharacterized protein LOC114350651 n=1 Tax=Ostrinia furnacalis TaxID=93504 RepID=UPI00103D1D4E|nr:uncharacterized protein LOC114350651 [Ostrinia furnacalis]XP_028157321.1 uncharacterized protein LOC114350651 [Ostrinia furnacalis]